MRLEDFYNRLGLEVKLAPVEDRLLNRVAELVQQAAAFNLTAVQRSPSELWALATSGRVECWGIQVRDRFGDYGLAGAVIFKVEAQALALDTFVLNCRVLGKRVEYHVIEKLGQIARQRGVEEIRLRYHPTSKNSSAKEFVDQLCSCAILQDTPGSSIKLPVEKLEALTLGQASPAVKTQEPEEGRSSTASDFVAARWQTLDLQAKSDLLTYIATQFRSGQQILDVIRQQSQRMRPKLKQAFVEPRTPTEALLTRVWAELLGLERVGALDNFFDLGGHSLQITQLMFRLSDMFQANLPVRALIQYPTVESMAQIIDTACQQGQATTTPAACSIDLNTEAVLDPTISCEAAADEHVSEPAHIFLTGATGFVGAFLLHELLQQTQANIHCLVRKALNVAEAKKRIQENLERYLIWDESASSRIVPVVGDLSLPYLGLTAQQFQELAEQAEVIYHCAADVNLVLPYSVLKPTNVHGIHQVLRLASQAKPKPVHFVSTMSVLPLLDSRYRDEVFWKLEGVDQEAMAFRSNGYMLSKLAAERLVSVARERGLPVCVYRLGNASGHSQTGVANTKDFVHSLIKGCLQLGYMAADVVNLVPVDFASKAIMHLSRRQESLGKVFHLTNPSPLPGQEFVSWFRSLGYRVEFVSHRRLLDEVNRKEFSPQDPLYPFLTLTRQADLRVETSPDLLRPRCQHTFAELAGTGIHCPPVDARLLGTYYAYFVRSGFLAAPS